LKRADRGPSASCLCRNPGDDHGGFDNRAAVRRMLVQAIGYPAHVSGYSAWMVAHSSF
jgi:hypothetical protein